MKVKAKIYRDKSKSHRWRITSRNRKIIAESGEGYERPGVAKKALQDLIQAIRTQPFIVITTEETGD